MGDVGNMLQRHDGEKAERSTTFARVSTVLLRRQEPRARQSNVLWDR